MAMKTIVDYTAVKIMWAVYILLLLAFAVAYCLRDWITS